MKISITSWRAFGLLLAALDIGSDLGSPVSLDYFDNAPFAFNGKIITTKISYPKKEMSARAAKP